MRAGTLRHWITIQRGDREPNAHGQLIETWRDFWSGNASIETVNATESLGRESSDATATHKIVTRYVPGIIPRMRLRWGNRTFNVVSAVDHDCREIEIEIMAREALQ